MKTYLGKANSNDWKVFVCDDTINLDWNTVSRPPIPLDPRHDLQNHSPDGFAWGYNGSGPAQLSLAILADLFDDKFANKYYQQFKATCIANLSMDDDFVLTEEDVKTIVGDILVERIDSIVAAWSQIEATEEAQRT